MRHSTRLSQWVAGSTLPALMLGMLWLTGCSSTPVTHQYTLPQHTVSAPVQAHQALGVMLMPVQLAGHLQVNGIVFQTSPIEVNEARNNLWADSLSNQLDRALSQALVSRLRSAVLIPGDSTDVPTYYVALQLDQFQGRYDGKEIISGQYRLMNADRRVIKQQNFSYEEPLSHDGYPALIEALDTGIQQLASDISQTIGSYSPRP